MSIISAIESMTSDIIEKNHSIKLSKEDKEAVAAVRRTVIT